MHFILGLSWTLDHHSVEELTVLLGCSMDNCSIWNISYKYCCWSKAAARGFKLFWTLHCPADLLVFDFLLKKMFLAVEQSQSESCPYSATSPYPGYTWTVNHIALLNPLPGKEGCGAEKTLVSHLCGREKLESHAYGNHFQQSWSVGDIIGCIIMFTAWDLAVWIQMIVRQMRKYSMWELGVYRNVTIQICLLEREHF